MRDKKKKQPECSQCGRKRGVLKDPCSKPCEDFKANHEDLMQQINTIDEAKKKSRQKTYMEANPE